MRISLFSLLVGLSFISCQKESMVAEQSSNSFPGVSEDLWPYFERFEAEASARGISVDLRSQKILGEIAAIAGDGVAGTCNYDSHHPNQVTIDRQFWNASSLLIREMVVFHELGHCELVRDHREAQDTLGRCQSIMASGLGDCFLNYNSSTRAALLDELFDGRFAGDWFN